MGFNELSVLLKLTGITKEEAKSLLLDYAVSAKRMDKETLTQVLEHSIQMKKVSVRAKSSSSKKAEEIFKTLESLISEKKLKFSSTALPKTRYEIADMLGIKDRSNSTSQAITKALNGILQKMSLERSDYCCLAKNGYVCYKIEDSRTSDTLNKLIKESSPDLEKLLEERSSPTV